VKNNITLAAQYKNTGDSFPRWKVESLDSDNVACNLILKTKVFSLRLKYLLVFTLINKHHLFFLKSLSYENMSWYFCRKTFVRS